MGTLISFPRDIARILAKLLWLSREEPLWGAPSVWEEAIMGPLSAEAFSNNAEDACETFLNLEKVEPTKLFAMFVSFASGVALTWSRLGLALYQGNEELSKLILDTYHTPYHLNLVGLENSNGVIVYPLGLAIAHCPGLTSLLLKKGAKQTTFVYLDGFTYSPIEFALHFDRPALAELLKQRRPMGQKIASKFRQLSPRKRK